MMRRAIHTRQFKHDVKRTQKRGMDMERLKAIIARLAAGENLGERYKDHSLRGNYEGYRECHLAPDWLLIYIVTDEELILARTGTHSDLFDK
jgi:mRNA interferase YafQ